MKNQGRLLATLLSVSLLAIFMAGCLPSGYTDEPPQVMVK